MLPATMKALVIREWGGPLALEEVRRPEPGPGEVLVEVHAAGVGLGVLETIAGRMGEEPGRLPRIPGHEVGGVVAQVGDGVRQIAVGQRVISYFYLTCGACEFCRQGRDPLCLDFRGFVGVDIDGGYAEYVVLPESNVLPLPPGIPFVDGCVISDAIGTPYHVCSARARLQPGETVLVVGAAGGVGIHMVQMARLFGARVIAADVDRAKLERTARFGADCQVDPTAPDATEVVRAFTAGRGVEAAVALAGTAETYAWVLGVLRRGGRLIVLPPDPNPIIALAPRQLARREITVAGSRYVARHELARAIELVRRGDVRPVVSEIVPLERAEELHDRIRARTLFGRGALRVR